MYYASVTLYATNYQPRGSEGVGLLNNRGGYKLSTTPQGKKAFTIILPETMAGEFINLFPQKGERTAFLREAIAAAIMFGKKEKLSSKVVELLQRREEDENI